jgi:hypothetical protein
VIMAETVAEPPCNGFGLKLLFFSNCCSLRLLCVGVPSGSSLLKDREFGVVAPAVD